MRGTPKKSLSIFNFPFSITLTSVLDRFLRYVKIDTQSDPHSTSFPSTEKQRDLSQLLVVELQTLGVRDAHLDEYGYVYATIPATLSLIHI